MKFLAFLLPLLMMLLLVASDTEEEFLKRCLRCFDQDEALVCSTNQGTYYNLCALKCAGAEYHHDGICLPLDLKDNIKLEK